MEDKSKTPGNNTGEDKSGTQHPEVNPNLSYIPDFEWTPPPPPPTESGSTNDSNSSAESG